MKVLDLGYFTESEDITKFPSHDCYMSERFVLINHAIVHIATALHVTDLSRKLAGIRVLAANDAQEIID